MRAADLAGCLKRPHAAVHLVGIGGIGMAGLARLLAQAGFRVSGSDLCANRLTDWLSRTGVVVHHGHSPDHVPDDIAWAVRSTAVRPDHPELERCRARGAPVFSRGVVLADLAATRRAIAVSGTHGKTTTTAMIARILQAAGRKPGFFVGGERSDAPVADLGTDTVFVTEADESDGTVEHYEPEIAVVTNIEYDHMEHFDSAEHMEACLATMMRKARRCVVYGFDDPAARRLAATLPRTCGFGFDPAADICGKILDETRHGTLFELFEEGRSTGRVLLPVHGSHNVLNALAAYAAIRAKDIDFPVFCRGMAAFRPVMRRFELCGHHNGALVISDYAHHPTAIRAVIRMAKRLRQTGRLLAIFQPHRYTRTRALRDQFQSAFDGVDRLVICPVYAASETPLPGGCAEDLQAVLPVYPDGPARLADSCARAWELASADVRKDDILLLIGAGDVDELARDARFVIPCAPQENPGACAGNAPGEAVQNPLENGT